MYNFPYSETHTDLGRKTIGYSEKWNVPSRNEVENCFTCLVKQQLRDMKYIRRIKKKKDLKTPQC